MISRAHPLAPAQPRPASLPRSPWRGRTAFGAAMFAAGLGAGVLLGQGIVTPKVKADTPPLAPAGEPARPASPSREAARGVPENHPADVLRVLDGDTFEARVRVWPGIEITTKVPCHYVLMSKSLL